MCVLGEKGERTEHLFLHGCAVFVISLLGQSHSPSPGQSRAVGPAQSSLDERYSFLIQEGRFSCQ